MDIRCEIDLPILHVELLDLNALEPYMRGVIRTKWANKHVELCHTKTEQLIALWDNIPLTTPKENWFISLSILATAFRSTKLKIKRMIDRQKKHESGRSILPAHRPSKITPEQFEKVKEFIYKRETIELDPPEIEEVCEFIQTSFNITYQSTWLNTMVKKSKGIYIVDADPLEEERINVTESDLRSNHIKLSELLKTIDPRLLVNIDESGWGKKLKTQKKRVVSLNPVRTIYREKLAEGHITVIPTSWANGDFSRTMIIIQTKAIERNLLPLGVPDGPNALIVASTSGYVTTELFIKLIQEILIPDVRRRRDKFGLQNSRCLLILDGAIQHHSPEITRRLEEENIGLHFLVPHSSHLTQPLDCLFFKMYKSELKRKQQKYTDLSKSSNRLVHTLSSLSKTTGWYIGLRSWHRAGFLISLEKEIPTLTYDISVILERQTAPMNELKVAATKVKRKREKVFFSATKKVKQTNAVPEEKTSTIEQPIDSNKSI